MIAPKKSPRIALALERQSERLAVPFTVWPTYVLIPVGFMLLLSLFIPIEVNPRLFSLAKPLQLSGEEEQPSSLWFAVAPSKAGVSISTIDGQVFEMSNDVPEEKRGEEFRAYLKGKSQSIIQASALANRLDQRSSLVVLSADERLTYYHLRPVIYALASAGITRYAFEGRILKD